MSDGRRRVCAGRCRVRGRDKYGVPDICISRRGKHSPNRAVSAAAQINDTGHLIGAFGFDLALQRLHRMAAAYAWEKSA